MSSAGWAEWFESVWADREENIYPQRFGPDARGIFALPGSLFSETFKQPSFDPRWLTCGVFEFRPTATRSSWLYVTSGMSNAWEDDKPNPDGPSGFGHEFVMETTAADDWYILRLQFLMAWQILREHGRYPGRGPLAPYDRVPLQSTITAEPSDLCWLILAPPVSFEPRFALASGWVELVQVFGATEDEAAYAREHGGEKLVELLSSVGTFPVIDPRRTSAIAGR